MFVNVKSNLLNMLCGVPQGSILGPKLFLIDINDLCNVSDLVTFILFADDTNIFYFADDPNMLSTVVNQELVKLQNWFAVNKLSLNVNKTSFMFGTKRNVPGIKV